MVLKQIYEQQQYMCENNVHTVPDRIVSISQPYIRPIVHEKATAPVEFGAKPNLSIDENGMTSGCPDFRWATKKDAAIDKKTEYADNADRVEAERSFSLAKRCYGLGTIMTNLDVTTRSFVALSILVINVARIAARSFCQFLTVLFSRYNQQDLLLLYEQNCHVQISMA